MGLSKSSAPVDATQNVREFIIKKFPLARKQQIKDSDPLLEMGILDSMGILEIVTFMEQEYGITVSDEDLIPENFQAIECMAGFIRDKISQ